MLLSSQQLFDCCLLSLLTKHISVVALIVIYHLSFQGVTTYPTLTSTGCVPSEPKILLDLQVSSSSDQLSNQQFLSQSKGKSISRTTPTSVESQFSRSTSKSILKTTFPVGLKSIQSNKTFRARLPAALNRATREG